MIGTQTSERNIPGVYCEVAVDGPISLVTQRQVVRTATEFAYNVALHVQPVERQMNERLCVGVRGDSAVGGRSRWCHSAKLYAQRQSLRTTWRYTYNQSNRHQLPRVCWPSTRVGGSHSARLVSTRFA